MMSFSFLGLWQFLLERWKRLLSVLLIALALGLAWGAYGNLIKIDYGTAREEVYVPVPVNLSNIEGIVYFNNLYTAFVSPVVSDYMKKQLQPGEHLTINNSGSVPDLTDKNEVVMTVIHVSNTSYYKFGIVSASESRSNELLDILAQQCSNEAKKIVPGFHYTVPNKTSSTTHPVKSTASVVNMAVTLACLAFIAFAGLLSLFYLFSDYIANSDALAYYFDKKMLGDVYPKRREAGKTRKESRQFAENGRAADNLKLFLDKKHSILLFGGHKSFNIDPVAEFLEGKLTDSAHIVRISSNDNPDEILSALPVEKTSIIIAPSILASELTGQLASRADATIVVVKRNKTRLKDIHRSLKWLHAAGIEVDGFIFLD